LHFRTDRARDIAHPRIVSVFLRFFPSFCDVSRMCPPATAHTRRVSGTVPVCLGYPAISSDLHASLRPLHLNRVLADAPARRTVGAGGFV